MPFRDAKYLVDGPEPFSSYFLLSLHGGEHFSKRSAEPPGLEEQSFCRVGIRLGESEEVCAAFRRNDVCGFQEENETVPRQFGPGRCCVDEVEAEPPTKQLGR